MAIESDQQVDSTPRRPFTAPIKGVSSDQRWVRVQMRAPVSYAYQCGVPFVVITEDGLRDIGQPGDYIVVDQAGAPMRVSREQFADVYQKIDAFESDRELATEEARQAAQHILNVVHRLRGVDVRPDPPRDATPVTIPPGVTMLPVPDLPPAPPTVEDVAKFLGVSIGYVQGLMAANEQNLRPISTPKPPTLPAAQPPKAPVMPRVSRLVRPPAPISGDDPVITREMPVEPHPADDPVPPPIRTAKTPVTDDDDDDPEAPGTTGTGSDDDDDDDAEAGPGGASDEEDEQALMEILRRGGPGKAP